MTLIHSWGLLDECERAKRPHGPPLCPPCVKRPREADRNKCPPIVRAHELTERASTFSACRNIARKSLEPQATGCPTGCAPADPSGRQLREEKCCANIWRGAIKKQRVRWGIFHDSTRTEVPPHPLDQPKPYTMEALVIAPPAGFTRKIPAQQK